MTGYIVLISRLEIIELDEPGTMSFSVFAWTTHSDEWALNNEHAWNWEPSSCFDFILATTFRNLISEIVHALSVHFVD